MRWTKDDPLRVCTAFSGYDSQCMALDRLRETHPGFEYELVAWSEIDRYAIQAHDAVYPQWADRNLGDISKIDWSQVPDFDLFTYSSPCTDFSTAGLQKGGEEGSGTRSSLLWECRRAIVAKRPRYLLFENVRALVFSKFIRLFNKWQAELEAYGYTNYAKVLNASDYGVPQNRERVFMVSILDPERPYRFPDPIPLTRRLVDVLESEVDERYYLSDEQIARFKERNAVSVKKYAEKIIAKWRPSTTVPFHASADGTAHTLTACYAKAGRSNILRNKPMPITSVLEYEDEEQADADKQRTGI